LPDPRLEGTQPGAAQLPRRHVDLDVELAQLGDEVRIGYLAEYGGVPHDGRPGGVDEIELDLQAGHGRVRLERRLREHPAERVEVGADLVAILRAVRAAERLQLDLPTHGR